MNRKVLASLALGATLLVPAGSAFAADAPATAAPVTSKVRSCTGAAEHRQAMDLRVQAVNLDLKAAQARRAEAVAKGNTVRVARIDANIARLNARLVKIAANRAALDKRCPA
jgi:hypothetical protein